MSDIVKIKMNDVMYAAFLVLCGHYGTGSERVEQLKADGFDADKVQKCVNDLVKVRDKYRY